MARREDLVTVAVVEECDEVTGLVIEELVLYTNLTPVSSRLVSVAIDQLITKLLPVDDLLVKVTASGTIKKIYIYIII